MADWISANEIERKRDATKKHLRQEIKNAENEFKRKEIARKRRKDRGDDKWLAPGILRKLDQGKDGDKKKKKGKKLERKEKKSKSRKKHKKSSSRSKDSSSSDSDTDGDDVWVDSKDINDSGQTPETSAGMAEKKEPAIQRDSWMLAPPSRVADTPIQDYAGSVKNGKNNVDNAECESASFAGTHLDNKKHTMYEKPGTHSRELNKYWRENGTGLPEEQRKKAESREKKTLEQMNGNDAHEQTKVPAISWRQKALLRLRESGVGTTDTLSSSQSQTQTQTQAYTVRTPGSLASSMSASVRERMHVPVRKAKEDQTDLQTNKQNSGLIEGPYDVECIEETSHTKADAQIDIQTYAVTSMQVQTQSKTNSSIQSPTPGNFDAEKPRVTQEEMNKLAAKILKNELMGNIDVVDEWKEALAVLRKTYEEQQLVAKKLRQEKVAGNEEGKTTITESEPRPEELVFTAPDRVGNVRPLAYMPNDGSEHNSRNKRRKVDTHDEEGQRTKYYANDNKTSLADMVETERFRDTHDYDTELLTNIANVNDDYDSDVFTPNMPKSQAKHRERELHRAISAQQKIKGAEDNCNYCIDNANMPKHLMICVGIKTFVMLPTGESMTPLQCMIVPMAHVSAINQLDEDVQDEIKICKKYLTKMYNAKEMDCVFMETAMNFKRHRHAVLECVPMDREVGEIAPMCFRKAMNESMSEWGANKKIITTRNGARCPIPKGFPYFHVEFGVDGGFANPIDNEEKFNHFFGKEIVGGMLDLEPRSWLKWRKESFSHQKQKVLEFSKEWQPYDWTRTLEEDD
eukprot:CFRG2608T1